MQEVAKVAKASTAKVADVLPNGRRGAYPQRSVLSPLALRFDLHYGARRMAIMSISARGTVGIALLCSACATMDSDGDRVETGSAQSTYPYGVYVPPNIHAQTPYAQSFPAQALSPYSATPANAPPASPMQTPPPAPSAPSTPSPPAPPSDPSLYAGDRGFSAWPSAYGPIVGGAPAPGSGSGVSNAQDVVRGMQAGFRHCYNRALQVDPTIRGTIRLAGRIGPSGQVVSVAPTSVVGLPATMIACLVAIVQSAQFIPPDGGGATIVMPVSFRSEYAASD